MYWTCDLEVVGSIPCCGKLSLQQCFASHLWCIEKSIQCLWKEMLCQYWWEKARNTMIWPKSLWKWHLNRWIKCLSFCSFSICNSTAGSGSWHFNTSILAHVIRICHCLHLTCKIVTIKYFNYLPAMYGTGTVVLLVIDAKVQLNFYWTHYQTTKF